MNATHPKVRKRDAKFAAKTETRIWQEDPDPNNPYLAENCRCHGYDIMELAGKRSFIDVLFLLFWGELPTPEQAKILETLMVALINPGPRHPATRAAIYAGCSRTRTEYILPIALSTLCGEHQGAAEVTAAMRFLDKRRGTEPRQVVEDLLREFTPPEEGDKCITAGFGSRYNGKDPFAHGIAKRLLLLPGSGPVLQWGDAFAELLAPHGMGWLNPGVCAAAFLDLGFPPRFGGGLFQLISAPGLLAHGLELADKPITSLPFLDEDNYIIEDPLTD
jgi:citrate synthase